jgi:beta-glucanase (GH16 family)
MKKNFLIIILLANALFAASSGQWKLVWSDEFDYNGLPDTTKWGYDVGCTGWGNQELESYTKGKAENARVENGTLIITARKEKVDQCNYSSARLVTKNKGDWVYGRFEISAKLPQGRGLWPAIWMLPTDNAYGIWPKSGEIDIMENVGFNPNRVNFTIHAEGSDAGTNALLDDPYTKFVVYALEWYNDRMDFYADDKKMFTYKNDNSGIKMWPFNKRFHMLLNIAVGGSWGGQNGVNDTVFPQSMTIDYVRVFKRDTSGVSIIASNDMRHSPPIITREKKRLIVRVSESKGLSVRLFSLSGKLLSVSSNRFQISGSGCVVDLPYGSCIAVIQYGAIRRTFPLAAVY